MENITNLLDATKRALGVETDYALAKKLGLPKQRICNYYKGERSPDEFACLKIAEALGKPLDTIIATVKATSEKDESRRAVWENYMKRLGGFAASIAFGLIVSVLSIVTTIVTSPTAEAHVNASLSGSNLYYVKSWAMSIAFSKVKSILRRIRQKCTFGMFVAGIA